MAENLNYKTITKSSNPKDATGGYKNVFLFARRDDFLSISKPVDVPAELGDEVTIPGAHTFTDPQGFMSWDCKTNSVKITGETVGEDGAQEIEWKATFQVLGDSASTQAQMQRILNDDIICLLKEAACLEDDSYVQLGDECISPVFKVSFDSFDTKQGKKTYTVEVTCKSKAFYAQTVTMSTETP